MSSQPMRRADKEMDVAKMRALLLSGYAGRLGSVGADGWPYVLPLLYVFVDDRIYMHNSAAVGHLRRNLNHDARVCFEVDQPGEVYGYGPSECDTSLSYASVIVFGRVAVVAERAEKERFCSALMQKYAAHLSGRPQGVFPRIDAISVYALNIERMTGKCTPLPAAVASSANRA